jgi:transposase InsO family protein
MVTSEEYRHVPTGTLALLAQRLGKVFASPTTWYRLVRRFHWRRPRKRVHPSGPKVGIRASRPDEIWHIDTTVIRLLDGSRAYLQAIIDNFSRRILAWKVSASFDPGVTAVLLHQAVSDLGVSPTLASRIATAPSIG